MYFALRAMPCRCEYQRNPANVPMWFPAEDGGIERRQIQQCSRCAAIDIYELRYPEDIKSERP
jgi:hypothetical protein